MLGRSYGHAHCGGPRSDPHGHWPMALARIYGLYPTIYLILQCRCLVKNEPTTLVLIFLSNLPSTTPTKSPIPHIAWPRSRLMVQVKSLCRSPNQTSTWSPEHLTIYIPTKTPSTSLIRVQLKIPNQQLEPISVLGSIGIFQPNILPHYRVRVRLTPPQPKTPLDAPISHPLGIYDLELVRFTKPWSV